MQYKHSKSITENEVIHLRLISTTYLCCKECRSTFVCKFLLYYIAWYSSRVSKTLTQVTVVATAICKELNSDIFPLLMKGHTTEIQKIMIQNQSSYYGPIGTKILPARLLGILSQIPASKDFWTVSRKNKEWSFVPVPYYTRKYVNTGKISSIYFEPWILTV